MPDFFSFSDTLEWVLQNSYLIIFVAMLIEGPVVTSAAGFASALGYLNVWVVIILSFFGDFISDIVYYFVGYLGRLHIAERYGNYLGLTRERMERIEQYLKKHTIKGLVIIKFVPVLPTFALIVAGALRIPIKTFIWIVTLVIIPRSLLFTGLGYYFGRVYDEVNKYLRSFELALLTVILLAILGYFGYKWFAGWIAKKIQGRDPHQI